MAKTMQKEMINKIDLLSCWKESVDELKFLKTGEIPPMLTGEFLVCPPELESICQGSIVVFSWKTIYVLTSILPLHVLFTQAITGLKYNSIIKYYCKFIREFSNGLIGSNMPNDYKVTAYFRTIPEIHNNLIVTTVGMIRNFKNKGDI